jgi:hypothetical protein
MAFAAATTEKVLTFLGYPFDDFERNYVQGALDLIEAMTDSTTSAAAVTRIEGWLTQLETIETNINTERDIEGTTKLSNLRYEGRRLVSLVANSLKIEVRFDVFSAGAAAS